jgi:dephospho-CoA kinase
MIKIGLTGNRYSGKDKVANLFKSISIPVFDADVILKFLINHNFELTHKISKRIDKSFFKSGDNLDINKVTGPVLDDIIDIVEPELIKAYDNYKLKNINSIYSIFHSSILFERGWDKKMDNNISVFSPMTDRVNRCREITNQSISDVYNLAQNEMKDLSKNTLSTYVIHNYDDDSSTKAIGDLLTQINRIDQRIIDMYLLTERKKRLSNGVY